MQPLLAPWGNFYLIVGTAAGALIGLQFVVIAIITSRGTASSIREIHAFGTPTVVSFSAAIVVSGCLTAPWPSASSLGDCLLALGGLGILYGFRVLWHARQTKYRPDAEDWTWYIAAPFVTYAALAASGLLVIWNSSTGLVSAAITTVLFLLLGVRNAWDTVTYIATRPPGNSAS